MLVAVVPDEADGILPYRLNFRWPRQCLKHGQRPGHRLERIAGLPAVFLTLLVAQRARAGITKKNERVGALVSVFPFDVHASAGGLMHFDRLGICFELCHCQAAFAVTLVSQTAPVNCSTNAAKPGELSGPCASPAIRFS